MSLVSFHRAHTTYMIIGRFRDVYSYSASPSRSRTPSPSSKSKRPLSSRLDSLRRQVEAIEAELSNTSNLHQDDAKETDPTAIMRGLVEIRGKLEGLGSSASTGGTGTNALNRALDSVRAKPTTEQPSSPGTDNAPKETDSLADKNQPEKASETKILAELDQRLVELEKVVGASNATLDEVCKVKTQSISCLSELPPVNPDAPAFTSTYNPSGQSTNSFDATAPHRLGFASSQTPTHRP